MDKLPIEGLDYDYETTQIRNATADKELAYVKEHSDLPRED